MTYLSNKITNISIKYLHLFSQYDTIILSGDGEDGIAFICNAFLYIQILNTGREREEILMKEKKKMSLAMQIFIALVLAIIAGLLMQNYADFAESYIKPFGTIFLNLIKFIVVPIVLFSIMCGIISMSDIRKVGSIGLKTVVFYLCTTAFAVTIGLIGGNLCKSLFPVVATTDLTYEAA